MTTASWLCRISWHRVVSTSSSPPGTRPNSISSRTAQQTQRCSVTRATAAKPMPVDRHTTSRMRGTAAMRCTAAMSALRSVAMKSLRCSPRQKTLAQAQPPVENLSRSHRCWNQNKIRDLTGVQRGVRCMDLVESKRPVVLIVEDEFLLRMDAVDMIEAAGFEVVEAANADEAIEILEARRDITVVFTDIQMPGSMDGLKLARAVRGRWPPIKIVATSGLVDVGEKDLPEGGRFLRKPYQAKALANVLLELTGGTQV